MSKLPSAEPPGAQSRFKNRKRSSRRLRVGVVTAYPHATTDSKSAIAYYAKTILAPLYNAVSEDFIIFADRLRNEHTTYEERLAENVTLLRCWRFGIFSPIRLFIALLRNRVDVIHLEYDVYLFGGIVAAVLMPIVLRTIRALYGTKVTTTLHGVVAPRTVTREFLRQNGFVLPYSRIGRLGFRIIYALFNFSSDRIIVLEPELRRILIDNYGLSQDKVYAIPLPLMNEGPRPDRIMAKEKLGITADRVVTFVGFASFYKGLDLLLDAYRQVKTKDSSIELHIVAGRHPRLMGQPKYEAFYARMLRVSASLGVRVYDFLPEHDLADVLAASSVIVLPYTAAYGGSAALNTALAARRPVLVSSVVYFEGALPLQVFEPTSVSCATAILRFFDNCTDIEQHVDRHAALRSVHAIATSNHRVRLGLDPVDVLSGIATFTSEHSYSGT